MHIVLALVIATLGVNHQFLEGFDPEQIVDGDYAVDGITGRFLHKAMVGTWTVTRDGKVLGTGTFERGAGDWTSFYPDGKKLAEGRFANNRATGTWTFFHPSGHVAAIGELVHGTRDGRWTFFYDDAAQTPISIGRFANGVVAGTWRHFDAHGKLLARAGSAPHRANLISITPGKDGVTHEMHGGMPASLERLDGYYLHSERLYVDQDRTIYDADGHKLDEVDGTWYASDCHWSAKRKRAAHAGDITTVHILMLEHRDDDTTCGDPQPLSPARGRSIDATLVAETAVRAPNPAFARQYRNAEKQLDGINGDDLASVLAGNMEWPHVDGLIRAVYATLPGYRAARE